MRIRGKILQGHGVASGKSGDRRYPEGTLKQQLPYFIERGLDLSVYYLGTINLDIAPVHYVIGNPKLFMENVRWSTHIPPENFFFFDLTVHLNDDIFKGLIYMPDPRTKVEHEQKTTVLELILPKIPNLQYGDLIEIEVPGDQMTFKNNIK